MSKKISAEARQKSVQTTDERRLVASVREATRWGHVVLAQHEERVVIDDPSLEGVAELIGFEDSHKLGRRPGGPVRIVTREGEPPRFVTAALPKEIMASGLLAPSLVHWWRIF